MDDKYYKPGDDTYTFISTLEEYIDTISKSRVIVEVGCGNGEISKFLKLRCKNSLVISTDINPFALAQTKKIAQTECIQSYLLQNIDQKHIDTIVFNPPYVETSNSEICYSDIRASYSGGVSGRVIIEKFIDMLTDAKTVYLLVIKKNDPEFILRKFVKRDYSAKIIKVRKIMAETVYIILAAKKAIF